jgi:hypothetical protein
MNIEQANTIPLSEILSKMNVKPERTFGHDIYFLAPYREERTASLHVNSKKNVWYDHGIGEGGDVVRLVCKYLERSGADHTVSDALRWVKNMMGFAPIIAPVRIPKPPKDEPGKLAITKIERIERAALIQYLDSRGLSVELARQYLKQITVYNRETKSSIFALGFKNDKGGYEIRNKFYKGSTKPKYITFIRGTEPKPDGVHFFEGWPDFLTALIYTKSGFQFKEDAIVLNSLANLKKATPYIKGYGYRTAYLWLDNDKAGIRAANNLQEFFTTEESLTYKPQNHIYLPNNDLNEWHMKNLGLFGSTPN